MCAHHSLSVFLARVVHLLHMMNLCGNIIFHPKAIVPFRIPGIRRMFSAHAVEPHADKFQSINYLWVSPLHPSNARASGILFSLYISDIYELFCFCKYILHSPIRFLVFSHSPLNYTHLNFFHTFSWLDSLFIWASQTISTPISYNFSYVFFIHPNDCFYCLFLFPGHHDTVSDLRVFMMSLLGITSCVFYWASIKVQFKCYVSSRDPTAPIGRIFSIFIHFSF